MTKRISALFYFTLINTSLPLSRSPFSLSPSSPFFLAIRRRRRARDGEARGAPGEPPRRRRAQGRCRRGGRRQQRGQGGSDGRRQRPSHARRPGNDFFWAYMKVVVLRVKKERRRRRRKVLPSRASTVVFSRLFCLAHFSIPHVIFHFCIRSSCTSRFSRLWTRRAKSRKQRPI